GGASGGGSLGSVILTSQSGVNWSSPRKRGPITTGLRLWVPALRFAPAGTTVTGGRHVDSEVMGPGSPLRSGRDGSDGWAACGFCLPRRRRRGCGASRVDHRRSRHLVRMALARDLQIQKLELLLERELLPLEGELRIELHFLMRGIGGDLGLLGLSFRRDLRVLGIG